MPKVTKKDSKTWAMTFKDFNSLGIWDYELVERGVVLTPDGIVHVQLYNDRFEETLMRIVVNKKVYFRQWKRAWTKRTCITLAKRFAFEAACTMAEGDK